MLRSPVKKGVGKGGGQTSEPRVSAQAAPYAQRIARLIESAQSEFRVDHLLVTNPLDVGYLTGFLGGESYLVVGPGVNGKGAAIISDGRYLEELEPQKPLAEIIMRTGSMEKAIADVLTRPGVGACGFQAEHLTLSAREQLERAVAADGSYSLVPTNKLVGNMRVIKDAFEIELIQTAVTITEQALLATLPTIKVGQSELDVAARLEYEMKRRGSSQPGFQSIVAAKANGSLPHYRPGWEKVTKNQPLLIDWGGTFMAYQGDMTRTFAVGKWVPKIREIYEIVREAQQRSADALAPGKSTHEVDRIARDYIIRHGYGEYFDHGLGHGLGISKEPPFLNPKYDPIELRVGHVCTVEPGIYLPGIGGVRIEDQYVITENGARNFCTLPKTAEWSVLG